MVNHGNSLNAMGHFCAIAVFITGGEKSNEHPKDDPCSSMVFANFAQKAWSVSLKLRMF